MNPQWETFWKQDLERRAEAVRSCIERNNCLMDVYKAKMDAYIAAYQASMALSDADLDAAWTKARSKNGPQWVPYFEALRAVAALVRKDDDALILQLVEALEKADKISGYPNNRKTITAGRARLGRPHD